MAAEAPDGSRAPEPGSTSRSGAGSPQSRGPEPALTRTVANLDSPTTTTTTTTITNHPTTSWYVLGRQPYPARRPPCPNPDSTPLLATRTGRPPNGAPRCADCPHCRALEAESQTERATAAATCPEAAGGSGGPWPLGALRRAWGGAAAPGSEREPNNACPWHRHFEQHGRRPRIGALFRLAEDVGGGGGEVLERGYGLAVAKVRELAASIVAHRGAGYYSLLKSSVYDCCADGGMWDDDEEEEEEVAVVVEAEQGKNDDGESRPDSSAQPQPQPQMDHTNSGGGGGCGGSSSGCGSWATIDGMENSGGEPAQEEEEGELVERPSLPAPRASIFGAIGDSRPLTTAAVAAVAAAAAEQPDEWSRYTWRQKGKWPERVDGKEAEEDNAAWEEMPPRSKAILAWMMDCNFPRIEYPSA